MVAERLAIVREFIERVWNEGNVGALDRVLAPEYCDHGPLAGLTSDGIAQFVGRLRNAVPDLCVSAAYLPSGDERVTVRWTASGTHAVHMLGYYRDRFGFRPEDYPGACDCGRYSMAIPLHNRMSADDYRHVADELKKLG